MVRSGWKYFVKGVEMKENKIELIAKAIRKECSSYSLDEWCESWGFTVEEFDKFLEYAKRYDERSRNDTVRNV